MLLYIAQSGDLEGCHACLTDGRTDGQTLKDRATQLLKKYKSGALVTQKERGNLEKVRQCTLYTGTASHLDPQKELCK